MVAGNPRAYGGSLRQALRLRTAALHDRLDAALGAPALGDDQDYARFLAAQYAARAPIERWASEHLAGVECPPLIAPVIAADLAELGQPTPPEAPFAFPQGGNPLGLAWALGGSSLGNAVLRRDRERAGRSGADRFLSDGAMAEFFRALRPSLERPGAPADVDACVAAAEAVFRTFLAAAAMPHLKAAA